MGEVLTVQVTAAGIRRLRLLRIGPWPLAWDYAEHALPSGLVVPSDSQLNIQDEPAFACWPRAAISAGLAVDLGERLGLPCALLLPPTLRGRPLPPEAAALYAAALVRP